MQISQGRANPKCVELGYFCGFLSSLFYSTAIVLLDSNHTLLRELEMFAMVAGYDWPKRLFVHLSLFKINTFLPPSPLIALFLG